MKSQDRLVKVIEFWLDIVKKSTLFPREIVPSIDMKGKEVIDIVGPRRSGKSSVLKLLIGRLPKNAHWMYINFEDPFFVENHSPYVIEELIETYEAYFGSPLRYLFLDEIQNIDRWETVVRKLRDSGRYKVVVTGSSSKLLSGELASLLSGRHLSYRLLPLSFREYLSFIGETNVTRKDLLVRDKVFLKHFQSYLTTGGFPEIVLTRNGELLKQYYDDILQRDIVNRYDVREKEILKNMGVFLMNNAAKIVSIGALKKQYDISYQLASAYLGYFEEAFLVFEIPQFSYSVKSQQRSLKKLFAVDTGLAAAVSFRFSEERGRMLENAVFLHAIRQGATVWYIKTATSEIDFVVKWPNGNTAILQVAWELDDAKTREREIRGLRDALKTVKGVDELIILTYHTRDLVRVGRRKVNIIPVYEWMCEESRS